MYMYCSKVLNIFTYMYKIFNQKFNMHYKHYLSTRQKCTPQNLPALKCKQDWVSQCINMPEGI